MDLGGVINNLLSLLGTKLLPSVIASARAPSSSKSPPADQNHQVEAELNKVMGMLERIKATLYDAEQREIRDKSVKLWLKELKGVAYDAEDVLGEYHYEVLRAEVEARDASSQDSRKRKLIQVPYGMLDQIQQIRSRFDEIMKDRIALQLSEGDGPMRYNNELEIAPTSHFVVESNIFGRESEKEKLIEVLSSERDVVSVVTIVGMGGIGKTTLAQLAYNDQRIRQRFDKFGWICVSEDFNVERLTKELMESITKKGCDQLTNLSVLQDKIREEISGKRVLLVLDDVWNEKKSFWDSFQTPFMSAKFTKILVTTRHDHVARIMQTEPTFKIGCLSTEQCWQLFEHYAFGGIDHNKSPKLFGIGKQIMGKCGMLPLAVKSIASLLRHEAEEESWRDILESELWETDASNEIFSSLQISYARLPTYLKSCFLYCSMFPKDHVYDVEALVKLWMYQGFIESKGNKTTEKIGFEYAQQLCQRSLFERGGMYERNDLVCRLFKLHDIVHDLARHNSENGCFSIEFSKLPIFPNVLHHLYIAKYVRLKDPIPYDKFTTLRTLITHSFDTFDFSMALKLRALQIENLYGEFDQSISSMKHLRYLSLGNVGTLPECICSLYSLQNLSLKRSSFIMLPTKIGNLISLEELIINECDKLEVLPESLCQLKALRELSICYCVKIKELPNNIGNLISLEELIITKCDNLEVLPDSLCQLKALRKLSICPCVKIKELPNNIGNLISLDELIITNCDNLKMLPDSLCQLKTLRKLSICPCVKIKELPNNIGNLISLEELIITKCDNLEVLPDSLCQLKALRKFFITEFHKIKELPNNIGNVGSLEELRIEYCSGLRVLPGSLCQLKALRKLFISGCHKIKELPNNIGNVVSLEELRIECCSGLRVLPSSLCQLKALRKLCLIGCVLLGELPSDIGSLTDLKTLKIRSTGLSCLPSSLSKFVEIQELEVSVECKTIGWLKDFPVLGGTLCLIGLKNISNLMDVQCANLMSMHNLEHLALFWNECYGLTRDGMPANLTNIKIKRVENIFLEEQSCFSVMTSLQPHPNLTKLEIYSCNCITFPEWIGNLCKLKYLKITSFDSLQFLKAESLPLELEQLEIYQCYQLVSMPGIQNLKSLVKLSIRDCQNLCSFMEPSLELSMRAGVGSYGTSLLGLTNLPSLRSLKISDCKKLQVLVHELLPAEPCKVEVRDCPRLKEWCLQHGIVYKERDNLGNVREVIQNRRRQSQNNDDDDEDNGYSDLLQQE